MSYYDAAPNIYASRGPVSAPLRSSQYQYVKRRPEVRPPQHATRLPPRPVQSERRDIKDARTAPVMEVKKPVELQKHARRDTAPVTAVKKPVELPKQENPKPVKPEPIKQDLKKPEANKSTARRPIAKPVNASGCKELTDFMSKMLSIELNKLLNTAFGNHLDVPTDERDFMFVRMLRTCARPDLKNVLGLNVTKRLLNVFNALCVKIKFNAKPEKDDLREFLKKYNFVTFSRSAVNIFIAQVASIHDFDRICTEEEVKCGSLNVSVTPEYKFDTCPPKLQTIYKDNVEDIIVDKNAEVGKAENKNTNEISKNISPEKQEKTTPTKAKTDTVTPTKPKEDKPVVPKASVQNNTVTKSDKPTQNSQTKENTTKKTETKVVTPSKPQKPSTVTTPKETVTKTPTKTQITPTKTKVVQVTPTKTHPPTPRTFKPTPTKQKKCSKITPKKLNEENDFDELDDHDILALMSEGIVLDECCGSDEE